MARKADKDIPKRGNRLGSVRELPSGKWQARVSIEGQDGSVKRVTLGSFKTKTEANQALSTALTDASRGQFAVTNKTTLEDYLKAWHEVKKKSQAATYALHMLVNPTRTAEVMRPLLLELSGTPPRGGRAASIMKG